MGACGARRGGGNRPLRACAPRPRPALWHASLSPPKRTHTSRITVNNSTTTAPPHHGITSSPSPPPTHTQNVYGGRQMTEEEITGLLIAVLFAGQHTSSITSSWTGLFMVNAKAR